MDFYERLNSLIKSRGLSQRKVEMELGFSNGAISKWKKYSPNAEKVKLLAQYFNVSFEYLMTGTKLQEPQLTARDNRDIAKDLDRIMGEIRKGNDGPLYYNGIEISDASINLLENAIEFALKETKLENKVKYNPYKNKSR